MRRLRIVTALVVLGSLAPMLSMLIAAGIARLNGCTLHEGFANPCVVWGIDIGGPLYSMAVMGWLMLLTLPIGALALTVWVVTEIVAAVRRRQAAR